MALSHSPLIVTDGLVFMYDTGNRKSYVGEPTVNTAGTTGIANYWNNSGTAAWSSDDTNVSRLFTNLPVFSMDKLTAGNSHIGIGSTSATVSTEYTYSVYVWIPSSNSVNMAGNSPYFRPQPANAGVGSLTYDGSSAWGTWPRDQWVRVSITATTQATNVTSAYISCYLDTAGDKIYFTAPQFEQKGHATPFVNGTRSATQGLIDRTNNTTIDISDVSFDSNAQMTFDGTDDFISIPTYTFGNGSWTLNMWVKADDFVNFNLMSNSSGGPVTNAFGAYANKIFYYNYNGAWQGHSGNTTLSTNTWYMLTWVNYAGASASAGTMKMYVNGIADSSAFNSYTTNGGPCNAIGKRWGGTPFNGNISGVSINTKSLSDAEVLQNFNAIKSRFGL